MSEPLPETETLPEAQPYSEPALAYEDWSAQIPIDDPTIREGDEQAGSYILPP